MMKQYTSKSGFFSGLVSIEPIHYFFNQYLQRKTVFGQNRELPLTYSPSTQWLTLILYFAMVTATNTQGQRQHLESILLPSYNSHMEKTASPLTTNIGPELNKIDRINTFNP